MALRAVISSVCRSTSVASVSVRMSQRVRSCSIKRRIVSKLESVPRCLSCAWFMCRSCARHSFLSSLSGKNRSVVAPNETRIWSACSM